MEVTHSFGIHVVIVDNSYDIQEIEVSVYPNIHIEDYVTNQNLGYLGGARFALNKISKDDYNGYDYIAISNEFHNFEDSKSVPLSHPTLTYIGTIAEWFDFNLIIHALDKYQNLEVRLYGPVRTSYIPPHERLKHMGSVNHDKIMDIMHKATGLIMPFIVNDLILSVNPVKLYEYIYSGKPIAAIKYGESEKICCLCYSL